MNNPKQFRIVHPIPSVHSLVLRLKLCIILGIQYLYNLRLYLRVYDPKLSIHVDSARADND